MSIWGSLSPLNNVKSLVLENSVRGKLWKIGSLISSSCWFKQLLLITEEHMGSHHLFKPVMLRGLRCVLILQLLGFSLCSSVMSSNYLNQETMISKNLLFIALEALIVVSCFLQSAWGPWQFRLVVPLKNASGGVDVLKTWHLVAGTCCS